jgi:acetyl-CoA synthetase
VPYERTLDMSAGIMWPEWFVGGRLDLIDNICGKHARRNPGKIAIRWESDAGEERCISYRQLDDEVLRVCAGLRGLGMKTGDRLAIYMPMIPEAAVMMLAAARLGVISVPMFSGYSADSVAQRVRDAGACVLACASGYQRRGRPVRMLGDALAAAEASESVRHVIVVDRLQMGLDVRRPGMRPYGVLDYRTLTDRSPDGSGQAAFPADQPLMLIYTSGTTGKPKGVVHTHAGLQRKRYIDVGNRHGLVDGSMDGLRYTIARRNDCAVRRNARLPGFRAVVAHGSAPWCDALGVVSHARAPADG